MLAADSGRTEGGLARQDAHLACVIVVGEVVIPEVERTVLNEVIRQVVLAGVDRASAAVPREIVCVFAPLVSVTEPGCATSGIFATAPSSVTSETAFVRPRRLP